MRTIVAAVLTAALAAPALAGPDHALHDEAAELAECMAGVARLAAMAATLPAGDLSRRFAENELRTAVTEAEAGDVDECPALLESAERTLADRPYNLRPGERLRGYGPDDAG